MSSIHLSQLPEVNPDESISQINYNPSTEDGDDDDNDLYGDKLSRNQSQSTRDPPPSTLAHTSTPIIFIVQGDQHVIEADQYLKPEFKEFKWRFQRERQGNSKAWLYFEECVHRTKGIPLVICKYCRKQYDHPSRNIQSTTSSLLRHISE